MGPPTLPTVPYEQWPFEFEQNYIHPSVSYLRPQLRYLQTLNSISAEKNSTIIFPFPMELLSQWSSGKPLFGGGGGGGGGGEHVPEVSKETPA